MGALRFRLIEPTLQRFAGLTIKIAVLDWYNDPGSRGDNLFDNEVGSDLLVLSPTFDETSPLQIEMDVEPKKISAPGYSTNKDFAMVRFQVGPSYHGVSVTYFLQKVDESWTIPWKYISHYM